MEARASSWVTCTARAAFPCTHPLMLSRARGWKAGAVFLTFGMIRTGFEPQPTNFSGRDLSPCTAKNLQHLITVPPSKIQIHRFATISAQLRKTVLSLLLVATHLRRFIQETFIKGLIRCVAVIMGNGLQCRHVVLRWNFKNTCFVSLQRPAHLRWTTCFSILPLHVT